MPPHTLFCKTCGTRGTQNFEVLSVAAMSAKIRCKTCGKVRRTSGRHGMRNALRIFERQREEAVERMNGPNHWEKADAEALLREAQENP